jgi:hypothetical protein
MKEPEYTRLTYDLTLHVAQQLVKLNPAMTFCYVSGAATDSTEKGKIMWARVKGKTENDLLKLPFKKVYCFRPGIMKPTPGLKNTLVLYSWLGWTFPLIQLLFPSKVSTLSQVGQAMIHCTKKDYGKSVLEVKDFLEIANDQS